MSWWSDTVGDSASSDNNKSVIARLGAYGQKYTDPLSWIFGKRYRDFLVRQADSSNAFLSKGFFKPAGKYLGQFDPIRQSSKEADAVGDWGEAKPVDTLALLAAAYFGGAAAAGSAAGGGGSAAAGEGAAGAGGLGGALGSGGGAGLEGVTVTASPLGGGGLGAGLGAGAGALTTQGMPTDTASMPQNVNTNSFDWQKLLKQMQAQQENKQAAAAPSSPLRPVGNGQFYYFNTPQASLGHVGATLRPQIADNGITAPELKSLSNNALLRMRLGMLS